MVNSTRKNVWLIGAGSGAAAVAAGLEGRGLQLAHAVDAAGLDPFEAGCPLPPDALVFVAPRPPEVCEGAAIGGYVTAAITAFVAAAQRAVKRMAREKRGGAIVIVTDIAGVPGRSGHAAAATLSGALIGAGKCLAKELGRQDISVNLVAYGFMPELGVGDNLRPAERKLFEMMNLGKPGGIEHLLENIVHLIGNRHLMTGQVLHADDGLII